MRSKAWKGDMQQEETTVGNRDVLSPLSSVPLNPGLPQTAIFCSDVPLPSKQGAGVKYRHAASDYQCLKHYMA